MLECKALRLVYPVVINLIQINFSRRIVHVVLVRGITRPISARSIDLDRHQPIGGKCWTHDIDNLPRRIAPASQTADHVIRSDQPRLMSRLGRRPALRNLTHRLRREYNLVPGWQIQGVREAVENVLAFFDRLAARSPVRGATSTQKHAHCFFAVGVRTQLVAGLKPPYEETHPLPASLLSSQMYQLAALPLRQMGRMNQKPGFIFIPHRALETPKKCSLV